MRGLYFAIFLVIMLIEKVLGKVNLTWPYANYTVHDNYTFHFKYENDSIIFLLNVRAEGYIAIGFGE